MKKFLIQSALFGLLLTGLNLVLYRQGKALYFGNYAQADTTVSTFLLADSRGLSLNNFPADYGVANFSSNSDNYADMLRKLKYLIRHTQIRKLYISADDHMLSPYRERTNNQDISVVLTEATDYQNEVQFLKERYLKYYVVLFQPVVRTIVRSKMEAWVSRTITGAAKNNNTLQDGWAALDATARKQQAANRFVLQYPGNQPSAEMATALEQIAALCKENNIEIVAIQFPLSNEYLQWVNNTPYRSVDLFKKLSIPVLDYRSVYKDSLFVFKNQDHLNDRGGRLFTDLLFGTHNSQ